jgi:Predicted integral membrane protein
VKHREKWEGAFWSVHQCGEWLLRLAVAHLLWIGGTLLGGVVLGIFPATAAMHEVLGGQGSGGNRDDRGIAAAFWYAYRRYFWRSQLLGYALLLSGVVLWGDLIFFLGLGTKWSLVCAALLAGISLLHTAICCHAFALLVRLDRGFWAGIRQSFWAVAAFPLHAMVTVGGVFLCVGVMLVLPALPILLGASALVWWMAVRTVRLLEKCERKATTQQLRGETYAV